MKFIEEVIIDKHEMLYRIAFKYLNHHEDVLDALQETAYKAIKNAHQLKNKEYAFTWVVRILIRTCFDMLKRYKKYEWVELDERVSVESDDLSSNLELNEMILKINPKYRDVIVMKYIEGYKVNELSSILGKPEGTIKTWLRRGVKSLEKEVIDGKI